MAAADCARASSPNGPGRSTSRSCARAAKTSRRAGPPTARRAGRRPAGRRGGAAARPGVPLAPPLRPRPALPAAGRRVRARAHRRSVRRRLHAGARQFWQEDFAAAPRGSPISPGGPPTAGARPRPSITGARRGLAGQWPAAAALYRRAYPGRPAGRLADAALFGALRSGVAARRRGGGRRSTKLLTARRQWIPTAARASLFLAASDLVQRRRDRAGRWLDMAERAGRDVDVEVAYWRGVSRSWTASRRPPSASTCVCSQRTLPSARRGRPRPPRRRPPGRRRPRRGSPARRLGAPRRPARRLAAAGRRLGGRPQRPHAAARALAADRLAASRAGAGADREWPLWSQPPREPEETLLALGILSEGAPAVPGCSPSPTPTSPTPGPAAVARRRSQRAFSAPTRCAGARRPAAVALLPPGLRRLLYPFAYSELVVDESLRRQIDPYLLAAILREESRFDPRAMSPPPHAASRSSSSPPPASWGGGSASAR